MFTSLINSNINDSFKESIFNGLSPDGSLYFPKKINALKDIIFNITSLSNKEIGFLVMKNRPENHLQNFGQGAVYFGWLGTAVGLIAITGTPSFVWGNVEKLGPALAVAMLTVLYGYMVKLVTIGLAQD